MKRPRSLFFERIAFLRPQSMQNAENNTKTLLVANNYNRIFGYDSWGMLHQAKQNSMALFHQFMEDIKTVCTEWQDQDTVPPNWRYCTTQLKKYLVKLYVGRVRNRSRLTMTIRTKRSAEEARNGCMTKEDLKKRLMKAVEMMCIGGWQNSGISESSTVPETQEPVLRSTIYCTKRKTSCSHIQFLWERTRTFLL